MTVFLFTPAAVSVLAAVVGNPWGRGTLEVDRGPDPATARKQEIEETESIEEPVGI